jgi:hypothetical protein
VDRPPIDVLAASVGHSYFDGEVSHLGQGVVKQFLDTYYHHLATKQITGLEY